MQAAVHAPSLYGRCPLLNAGCSGLVAVTAGSGLLSRLAGRADVKKNALKISKKTKVEYRANITPSPKTGREVDDAACPVKLNSIQTVKLLGSVKKAPKTGLAAG